jgi:hypothetical protein
MKYVLAMGKAKGATEDLMIYHHVVWKMRPLPHVLVLVDLPPVVRVMRARVATRTIKSVIKVRVN